MNSKNPEKFQELGKGRVKRRKQRILGLFIDGTGLDRATRRIKRKVDMTALIKGVTAGTDPIVARYYTLIPYEDDSRHLAFLDAVSKAGFSVIVKRLPPKGITRTVSIDVEMAADLLAFSLGHQTFSKLGQLELEASTPDLGPARGQLLRRGAALLGSPAAQLVRGQIPPDTSPATPVEPQVTVSTNEIQRIVTVVCPSREMAYPISLANELGVETVTADFGQFNSHDILKSAAKWIDLSDSETIWRD